MQFKRSTTLWLTPSPSAVDETLDPREAKLFLAADGSGEELADDYRGAALLRVPGPKPLRDYVNVVLGLDADEVRRHAARVAKKEEQTRASQSKRAAAEAEKKQTKRQKLLADKQAALGLSADSSSSSANAVAGPSSITLDSLGASFDHPLLVSDDDDDDENDDDDDVTMID